MKRLAFLLVLISGFIHAQTTVNLRSLKTHYGNQSTGAGYSGNANSHSEFDNMVNLNSAGTTLYVDTTVDILSYQGPRGNRHTPSQLWDPPRWNSGGNPDDRYAIIYTGWFKPNKTGTYQFRTYTDDSHEFMIKGIGKTNDIVTKHYGWNTWAYGTATLDKTQWYEFEYRIQNYGGMGAANFEYKIPNGTSYNQLGGNNGSSHPFGEWSATDPNFEPITHTGYVYGAEEEALSGVTVQLKTQNKNQVGFSYTTQVTTTTNSNGYYSFNTTLDYNDYDYTIDIVPPSLSIPTLNDISYFTSKLISGVYNSKDYWRMDVNNDGKFSVADLYFMLAYMNGVVTQYSNTTPTTKVFHYQQTPFYWDPLDTDTDDKSESFGYGSYSLFDRNNEDSTIFYIIRNGHRN
jgi:hypothetical protein